jgi:hypothetical protein
MHNLQLVLLKGSELETLETRKEFHFDTRFRVLPKNFGIYGDKKVLDIEEIVVSTDTMSFDDYIETRKYHLVSSVFWNDSWFEDAVSFAQKFGIKRSEWFDVMLPEMENTQGPVRDFLERFVGETVGELFPTQDACLDFYNKEENFSRLLKGEVGDNLMYKYRAIASFQIWQHICKSAMDATRRILQQRGAASQIPDFENFWNDFHLYVQVKHADGKTEGEILGAVRVNMQYDIPQWITDGMPIDITPYKLQQSEPFDFRLSDEGAREMQAALKVWTPTLKGLTKMVTRIRMTWQIRRAHRQQAAYAHAAAKQSEAGMLPEQW